MPDPRQPVANRGCASALPVWRCGTCSGTSWFLGPMPSACHFRGGLYGALSARTSTHGMAAFWEETLVRLGHDLVDVILVRLRWFVPCESVSVDRAQWGCRFLPVEDVEVVDADQARVRDTAGFGDFEQVAA
jgi:hypothetical protein